MTSSKPDLLMSQRIPRLHHVTATVADAQADLDFYTLILGLRLVKKTVNFDNPSVYHLYYGDKRGSPSTLMTTFPYRGWGVPPGVRGAGQIHVTSFSVPVGALDAWHKRLSDAGANVTDRSERFGERSLVVVDPSGLNIELVEAEDERKPWLGSDVDEEMAIRGIHGVTLLLHDTGKSRAFLEEVLGFELAAEEGARIRLAGAEGVPGAFVELVEDAGVPAAVNGLGTVHHVAFEAESSQIQADFRKRLLSIGCPVTDVKDRQYFRSIYFREPGGVLYEIATRRPGMDIDEPVDRLGQELRLPPWEEPSRRSIEAQLPPLELR